MNRYLAAVAVATFVGFTPLFSTAQNTSQAWVVVAPDVAPLPETAYAFVPVSPCVGSRETMLQVAEFLKSQYPAAHILPIDTYWKAVEIGIAPVPKPFVACVSE